MKRRLWERLVKRGAWVSWAVAGAAALLLAALLGTGPWEALPAVGLLAAAAAAAHAVLLPAPADTDLSLGPGVTAAALVLLGVRAAAVVSAVGALVGVGLLRRRPAAGANAASQVVLATAAAAGAAFLVHPQQPAVASPLFQGRLDPPFALAIGAAAIAFAGVTVGLARLRVGAVRGLAPAAGLPGALVVGGLSVLSLYAIGATAALAAAQRVPAGLLLVAAPALLVGAAAQATALTRRIAEDADGLQAAADELARTGTFDEVVTVLAQSVDRLIPSEIVLVLLRPPGEADLQPVHYRGPGGMEVARQLEPDGATAQAMRTGVAVRIGDYERDGRRSPRVDVVLGRGHARAVLVAPVAAGREAWGAVWLAAPARHAFTARHERLLVALGSAAGLAIRGAHIAEQSRMQAERLAALQQAGLLAGTTLDPEEAGRTLVHRAAEMMDARYALLALVEDGAGLRVAAVAGAEAGPLAALRARTSDEQGALRDTARAVRDRRAVVSRDGTPLAALPGLGEARAAVTVPLRRHGQTLGALTVAYEAPRRLGDADLATLGSIAAQGAVMIDTARQHVALEGQLRTAQTLAQVARRLGAAADLGTVFDVLADAVRTLAGADRTALLVWDGHQPLVHLHATGLGDAFLDAVRQHLHTAFGRHVAPSAHPVIVPDLGADPRLAVLRDAARQEGVRRAGFFPMRAQGELVGILAVFDLEAEGGPIVSALEAVAEHGAFAVRHAALLAESERRRDELATLNRLAAAVSTSLHLTEVYRTAAAELAAALDLPRVSLYRVDGALLRLVAQVGAPDLDSETSASAGVKGRVVRSGRPEYVPNVRDDPEYVSSHFHVVNAACVPIAQEGAVAGVLLAEGTAVRPVTPRAYEFLVAFAQPLAVAVRNAAFYEEQRRAHDELQVLYEAARAVSGTLDLRTVLDGLVSVTCRAFGYDNGTIVMVDPESGDLTVEAAYGVRGPVVGTRLPAGAGISGWVARTGTPLVVDDVRTDTRYYRVDDRTLSELAVPLIAEGKVLGVFNVESARLAAFGPRDLRLLTTLASYAVVAIQNARLYETAQRMAITDGLTELYNHRYLHESLGRVLERARRDGQPVALIMLEIDHFKRYNDTYGHQSGDEALRTVAGLLRRGSRPSDIVARYGGDEFMVVLPGATKTAAQDTAERLRRAVEAYPLILGDEVITSVTLSVGVAAFPHDGETVDALVEAVDRAQYIAKRSGGNKVHVAHAS